MANLTVTKKVRLAPSEAAVLRRLAKKNGQSESDVIREGLRLMQVRDRRAAGIEAYIAYLGDEKEPPKIRFKLK
jgi:Arc/MetJ-type ribon-helix-helix transcriptional regulator